jgi:hypothetical protein
MSLQSQSPESIDFRDQNTHQAYRKFLDGSLEQRDGHMSWSDLHILASGLAVAYDIPPETLEEMYALALRASYAGSLASSGSAIDVEM